jgi:2-dehydropantoate 2-reductase
MRVLVVGPGAIGCMFAARLADSGVDVLLLGRDRTRCDQLAAGGLRIERSDGIHVYPANAICSGNALPDGARISAAVIAVKAYDTAVAGTAVAAVVSRDTPVISLQNGIGNADVLTDTCGLRRVICAVTSCGATLLGAGHVREAGIGVTRMAPADGQPVPEAIRDVARNLIHAGLAVELLSDAPSVVWSKAIINAALNPLTAIWGVRNGEVAEREDLRQSLRAAAGEGQRVAAALGIRLVYDDAAEEAERVCRQTSGNLSSMLQDVRSGRRTEVREINGAIVAAGRRLGIGTPINEELLRRVLELESQAHGGGLA